MSDSPRFHRRKEDFECANCGTLIRGNGYTNHCPRCLWSKHVDINPGDRASECGGMMEPVGVAAKGGEYILHHQCVECGFERNQRAAKEDDFSEIIRIAAGSPGK